MKTNSSKTTSLQKIITFSPVLYHQVQTRAKSLGLSFQEYVRHLLVNDIKSTPLLSKKTSQGVHESIKQYQQGEYEELDPSDLQQLKKAAGTA